MNNRRKLVIALGASALTAPLALIWPSSTDAQQQSVEIPRIGLLGLGSGEGSYIAKTFRDALVERGYVDGKNIRIEDRSTVEQYEHLPRVAKELVDLKVNIIVTWGSTATRAASKVTSTIPIVMSASLDPVKAGLAIGLAHPGRNVTGIITINEELIAKRIELLKEMLPGLKRLAILLNPSSSDESIMLKSAEATARALSLQIHVAEARTPNAIGVAITKAAQEHVGALMALPSTMLVAHQNEIVKVAATNRLPTISARSEFVEAGGLIAYGSSMGETLRRVTAYVDKILKGAKPGDLPIEQPIKFELVVNMKTAKALGIKIPNSILVRADKVIE